MLDDERDQTTGGTVTPVRPDVPRIVRVSADTLPHVTEEPVPRPEESPAPSAPEVQDTRSAEERHEALTRRVENLRAVLAGVTLDLDVPGVEEARAELTELTRHLDDYLLPRLRRMDAPLLAVVGGSTGAGKSTLVNSLVRREVSRSGVLRPTTRSPVLVHHPHDSGAFLSQRILPGLGRVTSEAPEPMQPIDVDAPRITALRLVPDDGIAPGLAVLDAPDIDSVVDTNRDLAVQLLSAADLWVFVTTAARYADALPWEMLRRAVERGAAVAIVLDRVPPGSLQEVRLHLATLLRDRGLAGAPMFTIPESPLEDGFLAAEHVRPLLTWLTGLAREGRTRELVARRTLRGAVASLPARAESIATAADRQNQAEARLLVDLDDAFEVAGVRLVSGLGDGSLLRGEVAARWRDYGGGGDLVEALRRPDRSDPAAAALAAAVRRAVAEAARDVVRGAVLATGRRWREQPVGRGLIGDQDVPADAAPEGAPDRFDRSVREWQDAVAALLVAEESAVAAAPAGAPEGSAGGSAGGAPRAVRLTAPGLGVVLTVLVLSPAEADGGPAVAPARALLDALVGEGRRAELVRDARDDLAGRLLGGLDEEQARFLELLDPPEARAVRGDKLRAVARAIEEER